MSEPRTATSVGRPVVQLAASCPVHLSVLSQHQRVVNLVTARGDLVALVHETVGPGPFNVVVTAWDTLTSSIHRDHRGDLDNDRLVVGQTMISLHLAAIWNPEPDWIEIGRSPTLRVNLSQLEAWFRRQRLNPVAGLDNFTATVLQQATRQVILPTSDDDRRQGLTRLTGLGPGLTPMGDDWLAGWLLRRHLTGPGVTDVTTALVLEQTASRTTRLSRAYLRAAAAGWVDAPWHQLLVALAHGSAEAVFGAARRITGCGATSGCAMLAGFLQETSA